MLVRCTSFTPVSNDSGSPNSIPRSELYRIQDKTDRGSEFTNSLAIEFNKGNGRRTHIFYCDPQRSDQKGGCEVTHEMIHRVLPKKTSFDNLTQDDINLMMSHINSYNRKKLNNQSAHQLFSFINGGDIFDKLGIKSIPANEINLAPLLLKNKKT